MAASETRRQRRGAAHWWVQRLTSVALVPLVLWFVASLVAMTGAGHQAVSAWLGDPVVATVVIILLAIMFLHAQMGLRVVIEDYVHMARIRDGAIAAMTVTMAAAAAAATIAVLVLTLGG